MKKRIRINENQLKELVEDVLNELDWRTYASAGEKRYKAAEIPYYVYGNKKAGKDIDSAYNLYSKAIREFNKKYGNKRTSWLFWPKSNRDGLKTYDPNIQGQNFHATKDKVNRYGELDVDIYDNGKYQSSTCCPGNGRFTSDTDPDVKEITDFQSGKTQYNKNTHQWESLIHNITENVIRKLRKM